jgi:hypothetical protein
MGKCRQPKDDQYGGLDGLIRKNQADMQFWRMALTDSQLLHGRMESLTLLQNLPVIVQREKTGSF